MKALKSILAVALGLICTGALAQTTLKEAVAPGNKVYVEIDNDDDHPIPQDEIEDVTRNLLPLAPGYAFQRLLRPISPSA